MPLDDAFQGGTSSVLLDMAQRPRPPVPQAQSINVWRTLGAAPKGLTAGVAEGMGSTAELLGAFGDVSGQLGDAGGAGMFGGITEQERKEANAARDKLLSSGPDYRGEAGASFRQVAKDYMPDPVTAHAAEQGVANLFRLGGKAVAAATTLGAVPGAIVAGAEEGFTASEELAGKGVDLATRTKVGALTAGLTAGSFAIPVAGVGVKSTVGYALAGGPASFVAQNWATREILKNANYDALGNQYDPFDPVGLTLSTLLPLGFGALALRGAKGKPVAHSAPEDVDAARVSLLKENIDSTRPTPITDLQGAVAHEAALSKALDQMADGERVNVSDVASPNASANITEALNIRLGEAIEELKLVDMPTAERVQAEVYFTGSPQEGMVLTRTLDEQSARANAEGQFAGPGHYTSTSRDLAGTYGGPTGRLYEVEAPFKQPFDFNAVDPKTRKSGQTQYNELVKKTGSKAAANAELRAKGFDAITFTNPRGQKIANVFEARNLKDIGPARETAKVSKPLELEPVAPKAESATALKSESPEIDRASNILEAEKPDMLIQLDGMDQPMRLGDLLKQVREDLELELKELPLIEAAAACFVR